MKGDCVEVVIDSGEGTRTYEVTATRAGRRVQTVRDAAQSYKFR